MQDVRPVNPAKEPIRKAILYFQEEGTRLVKRLEELERALDALQVVRKYSRNGAVGDVDIIAIQKEIQEIQAELERCKRRQDSLPTACERCGGRGTSGSGFGTHTCSFCKGMGFREPIGSLK